MLNLTHSDIQLFYSGLGSDAFTFLTGSILPDLQPATPLSSFIPQNSPLDGSKNLSKRKVISSETHHELNRSLKRIKTPPFLTPSKKSSNMVWTAEMIDQLREAVKTEGTKWKKVAEKIEGVSDTQCRNKWKKMHLDIAKPPRKGMKWTADKIDQLRGAVEAVGTDWEKVAGLIEGVTAIQCCGKWNKIKKNIIKGPWTEEEDKQLRKAVENYGKVWTKVAAQIPTRNYIQCSQRWEIIKDRTLEDVGDQSQPSFPPAACSMSTDSLFPELNELPVLTFLPQEVPSVLKIMDSGQTVKSGFWRNEEDQRLIKAVEECGTQWQEVALRVSTRDATQCANRWQIIDPKNIKITGDWFTEEDNRLREGVAKFGKRWILVSNYVKGRSHDQCRYRWNTKFKKTAQPLPCIAP